MHNSAKAQNAGELDFKMGDYIKEAFNLVKANPVAFIGGNLIMMIINGVGGGLLIGPYYAGMYNITNKARAGETVEFGDVFKGFENFGPLFLSGLITNILIGVGLFFCIIPGFIVGGILLWVMPLVFFQNMSINEAITKSKDIAMKDLGNHTIFFFLVGLVALIGVILCGVGILFTVPIGTAAICVAYEDIVEKQA